VIKMWEITRPEEAIVANVIDNERQRFLVWVA
jgi:hypothetical protein